MQSAVNLLSSVLDTPEFFWRAPDSFQTLYEAICQVGPYFAKFRALGLGDGSQELYELYTIPGLTVCRQEGSLQGMVRHGQHPRLTGTHQKKKKVLQGSQAACTRSSVLLQLCSCLM